MIQRHDYPPDAVEAARSVLIELTHLLSSYREHIVVIGGWVPDLILPGAHPPHTGSTDIDLALDHRSFGDIDYATIGELLAGRGYYIGAQPYIFLRDVTLGGRTLTVQVDLLSAQYEGTARKHRTQHVQDVRPRKARGCDLAFDAPLEVEVRGEIPGGAEDRVRVRVAAIGPFVAMKAIALSERLKEKDAYDICFCLRHYPGGIGVVCRECQPYLSHGLMQEALRSLRLQFESPRAFGPTSVANFEDIDEDDERAIVRQEAYQLVLAFLEGIDELQSSSSNQS